MKKNYIIPTSDVINVNSTQMLASSDPTVSYTDDKVDAQAEALGRQNNSNWKSIWE